MQDQQRTNWAFRIAILLGLVLGAGWGFLLGVMLVRLNTLFLFAGMLLTALPIAFFGGVLVAVAFHRLIPNWHKIARLIVILIFVALGMPFGLAYGVMEQQLDPAQFVNTTGALIWDLEWLFAILGLMAGTWTGWMRPFAERGQATVAPPVRFIASIPGRLVEALATFFETVGRGFLWLPMQLLRLVGGAYRNIRERWTRWWMPTRTRPRRQRQTTHKRKRPRLPKLPTRQRADHDDGPRIMRVVEDRCPYCLDIVKRNDPRGVQVCEVCHTPHHADCWAITGKCQVPHLNT
ncbi:MAG: hypothetical protein HY782_03790 [Chloroflexi bacterium]|nr:hypothetical protein [Chloroflexota bacterium]